MREVRAGHFAQLAGGIADDARISTHHRYGGPRNQVSARRNALASLYGLLHPVFAPDADCNFERMQIIEIESSDCTWFLGRMK